MLAQDSGRQLRGSTDVTANTMAEATSSSPATSTPCSIMSLLQERCTIASPSTGSEVIGWGKSTMKPAFGIFPSLEAAAQSPKTTPTSDGSPQVSPTTSTLKILEQMVAEEQEEKELVLSTTSGTIVLLPDHQQKPRSLPLEYDGIISPNDVRSRDADSTATTGTDPAERLSPPPRTPSDEWASQMRLWHFEHAQKWLQSCTTQSRSASWQITHSQLSFSFACFTFRCSRTFTSPFFS